MYLKCLGYTLVLLLVITAQSPTVMAADLSQTSTIFFRDAKNYLETIKSAQTASLNDQIDIWKNFLAQHPNTYYTDEIKGNLLQLETVLGVPSKSTQNISDTEILLKAKRYIINHKLSEQDQILLWQQFLQEHPGNDHGVEVKAMISELRFTLAKTRTSSFGR